MQSGKKDARRRARPLQRTARRRAVLRARRVMIVGKWKELGGERGEEGGKRGRGAVLPVVCARGSARKRRELLLPRHARVLCEENTRGVGEKGGSHTGHFHRTVPFLRQATAAGEGPSSSFRHARLY